MYYACIVQLNLGGLHDDTEVLEWLTKPCIVRWRYTTDDYGSYIQTQAVPHIGKAASFNAAMMLVAPAHLLNWSLLSFLVGVGLYLGLTYTKQLGETRGRTLQSSCSTGLYRRHHDGFGKFLPSDGTQDTRIYQKRPDQAPDNARRRASSKCASTVATNNLSSKWSGQITLSDAAFHAEARSRQTVCNVHTIKQRSQISSIIHGKRQPLI